MKNLKRFTALTLAAAMMAGGAMTAFAADGVAEGTGKYEGTKEEAIPVIAITLPTEQELQNIYNYIADPNGLLGETGNKSLGDSVIVDTNAAGILFKTETGGVDFAGTSKLIEVTSENYQDVDIKVELKVKAGAKGDADIVYVEDSTDFNNGTEADKPVQKELYLAITNGESDADKLKTAALPASGVVTLTQTAEGTPDNYDLKYENDKYTYKAKTGENITWNKVGFALTGAINTAAAWGKDVKFPTLQVTWSYGAHVDVTPTDLSASVKSVVISGLNGAALKKVTLYKPDGTTVAMTSGTQYTYVASTGTFTILKDVLLGSTYVGGKYVLDFGTTTVEIPIVAAS